MVTRAMLHITPEAQEKLLDIIKQNQTSIIRINEIFDGGTWACGASLRLTLDELPNKNDEVFEINGITYVIDKYVHKNLKSININFETKDGKSGFVVSGGRSDWLFLNQRPPAELGVWGRSLEGTGATLCWWSLICEKNFGFMLLFLVSCALR